MRKELRQLFQQFKSNGLTVLNWKQTKSHIRLEFADFPQPFFIAATPSDGRAYRNALADAKRFAKQHKESQP
jgi:hypothetical protein